MGGWRSKLIFVLVVYFAGFATAIYCLAPAPEGPTCRSSEKTFAFSAVRSEDFARSFNSGMHKCLDFAKDAADRASVILKDKLNETRTDG